MKHRLITYASARGPLRKSAASLIIAATVGLITSCGTSPVPVPRNFEASEQLKLRSAAHWQAIARHVVQGSAQGLKSNESWGPIYVSMPRDPTPFDRVFHNLLGTELIRSGFALRDIPEGAVIVTSRAELVQHRGQRPPLPATFPLRWTTLTAGLMVLGGLAAESANGAKAALLAGSGAIDALATADTGADTGTEVVVTTSFTRQGSVLAQVSNVYYLDTVDRTLFIPPPLAPEPLKVQVLKVTP